MAGITKRRQMPFSNVTPTIVVCVVAYFPVMLLLCWETSSSYAFSTTTTLTPTTTSDTYLPNFGTRNHRSTTNPNTALSAANDEHGNDNDVDDDNTVNGRFLLPPIGGSSSDGELPDRLRNKEGERKTPVAFVGSGKFEMQYTCKLCETRNSHKVSRLAYRKGVVIAVCKGCKGKHLIADNLGWSNYLGGFDGEKNIEEFLEGQGRGEDVNRVSPEVWNLENMLEISSNSSRTSEAGDAQYDDDDLNKASEEGEGFQ